MHGIVLVHGGLHSGRCWEPLVEHLRKTASHDELRVIAVDLPGRGGTPGNLADLTIEECVDSVVRQIDAAGIETLLLVGHSLAGITLPGIVERLGPERVQRTAYIAACVPAQGTAVVDAIAGPLRSVARRRVAKGGVAPTIPRWLARWAFCNGMDREQREFALQNLCPDSAGVIGERVRRQQTAVPSTWVLTTRDRALRPRRQRRFIANLGGVDEVVEIDACHDVMIEKPAELGRLLLRLIAPSGCDRDS